MIEPTRYTLFHSFIFGSGMGEVKDGEYVRYEDFVRTYKECDNTRQQIARMQPVVDAAMRLFDHETKYSSSAVAKDLCDALDVYRNATPITEDAG